MKKRFCLLTLGAIALILSACGQTPSSSSVAPAPSSSAPESSLPPESSKTSSVIPSSSEKPSSSEEPSSSVHVHTFASEWIYDENTHWHAATCGHDVKGDEEAHTLEKNPDETEESCACGYTHVLIEGLDKPKNLAYANDKVTFDEVTNAWTYDVKITLGEATVVNTNISTTSIDVSELSAGNYVASVTARRGTMKSEAATLDFTVLFLDDETILEAEDYIINTNHYSGDASAHAGAYGLAFNDCGQGMYFRYYAYEAGDRDITVVYSTGTPVAKLRFYLNGTASTNVEMDTNTGWFGDTKTSAEKEVTVTGFVKGWNDLYLIKDDANGNWAQIDYIKIEGTGKKFNLNDFDKTVAQYRFEAECSKFHYPGASTVPVYIDGISMNYCLGELNAEGDGGLFTYKAVNDGKYNIVIGLGCDGDRNINIKVNDGEVQKINVQSGSTAYNDIKEFTMGQIDLVAGKQFTIDISRPSDGNWFVFDYLKLVLVTE